MPIEKEDLCSIKEKVLKDQKKFFEKYLKYKLYEEKKIVAMLLVQGAALHFIDKKKGIKDFDVLCVYNKIPKKYFPFRRLKQIDSKLEKFGRSPDDSTKFKGRRIDIMMRAVNQKDLSKLFKYPRTKSFECVV